MKRITKHTPLVALSALLFMTTCGYAQPASATNDAEITVTGDGSALVVKCVVKKMPELSHAQSLELVVFVTRTNGPELGKDILETVYSSSRFRGVFLEEGLSDGSASLFDEICTGGDSKRVGYRFSRGLVERKSTHESAISVGEHLTSNSNARLGQDSQKFDLGWLGDDAIVRTALVVFKLPETQGGKSDFVKFLTPITTKRVSLKK